jgi:polynucleotide 5'-kinase involved in rRNA processing
LKERLSRISRLSQSCASIKITFKFCINTAPEEILARGPKAQEAYEIALRSGKTKYCRVPIMLIGQSRAGKTSLLRSLKRKAIIKCIHKVW